METEQTHEQQMLWHAKQQTEALESLRSIALVWSAIAGLAFAIWLIAAIASGG